VTDYVLDSSAVLAVLLNEPGADKVMAALPDAVLSAVNFAEVISKLCERGMPAGDARMAVEALGLEVVSFDAGQAVLAGDLRPATRALGLSLGDRACLALALSRQATAVTADAAWQKVAGIKVQIIR